MEISDELNHGSIIDGVRLTKAQRAVYSHNDMGIEAVLNEHSNQIELIITDGVFSMDGDIAHWMRFHLWLKNTTRWYTLMIATGRGSRRRWSGIVDHSNCKEK